MRATMVERYLMKCNCGINAGKFIYKCLSTNGSPVWATSIENAMKFQLREEAELFAIDKNILSYDIITIITENKKNKKLQLSESIPNLSEQ
jgi:hypothetical protein